VRNLPRSRAEAAEGRRAIGFGAAPLWARHVSIPRTNFMKTLKERSLLTGHNHHKPIPNSTVAVKRVVDVAPNLSEAQTRQIT